MSQPISSARVSPCHSVKARTPREHNARTGKAKKTKRNHHIVWIQPPSLPRHDRQSPGPGGRARPARRRAPIVPGAWMRVRLAWQVPRPIDDNQGRRTPGLIVVCYARARCDDLLVSCFWSGPGRDPFDRAPSRRRGRAPDELVLSPRCTHRLMEANFFCVARKGHLKSNPPPFDRPPPKPYLAAAAAVR